MNLQSVPHWLWDMACFYICVRSDLRYENLSWNFTKITIFYHLVIFMALNFHQFSLKSRGILLVFSKQNQMFYTLKEYWGFETKKFFYCPLQFLFIMKPKYLSSYLSVAIEAKLSPVWNKMSKYMVRRSDFLTRAFIEAVKTDIRVSENLDHYQVFLNLEGVVLRWTRPVTIQSLNIEEKYRGMFNRKEIDIISQLHIGNQWLCVLPNLTKAK